MKVTVKELKGKECDIEVELGWSVAHFKDVVETHIGTSPEHQRLILKGKVLQDEDTLETCGVHDKCRIIITEKRTGTRSQADSIRSPSSSAAAPGASPDSTFWLQLHALLKRHFTESDAARVLDQCHKEFKNTMSSLSLDDMERLAGALLEQR